MGEIHNAKDVVLWFLGSRKREARISMNQPDGRKLWGNGLWHILALGTPPIFEGFLRFLRFGILDDTVGVLTVILMSQNHCQTGG